MSEPARLPGKGNKGLNKGARPEGAAPKATRSSSKTRFTEAEVQRAKRTVTATIGNRFAKKSGKGNTYFSSPGVIGYVVRNDETGEVKAISRKEAVKLSLSQAVAFKEGKADSILFFKNAIHEMAEKDAKKKVPNGDGTFTTVTETDANGEVVKNRSFRLRGINGQGLLEEDKVADGRAIPFVSKHYSNKEMAQKAYDLYQQIATGAIFASEELKVAMAEAQTTKSSGGGSRSSGRNILEELDSFVQRSAEELKDTQLVEI